MVTETLEVFGGVDALVNNAGVAEKSLLDGDEPPIVDLPVDAWRTVVETNVTGAFLCTKAVLPTMLDADSGRIVHVSSTMGRAGRARRGAYAASKFALEGFHESLADELRDTGVDSLVLDPGGGVDTEGFSRPESDGDRLDPSVIAEPAVRLVGGEGANGRRYVAVEDF